MIKPRDKIINHKVPKSGEYIVQIKDQLQGSLCANSTLCTNETSLKFNIHHNSDYDAMVFDFN